MSTDNTIAEQLLEFLRNNANMDSDVIAENLVEFLTNTVNMTSVFYDIFLNPEPMTVELQQFNDENELVTIPVPNRALDRQNMIKRGSGSPEGAVEAVVGTLYLDTESSILYCKASDETLTEGWIIIPTEEFVTFVVRSYLNNGGYVSRQNLVDYLANNSYITLDYLNNNNYITESNQQDYLDKADSGMYGIVQLDGDTIDLNSETGQIQVNEANLTEVTAKDIKDTHEGNSSKSIWTGTQAEYSALDPVDPNTIYIIIDS